MRGTISSKLVCIFLNKKHFLTTITVTKLCKNYLKLTCLLTTFVIFMYEIVLEITKKNNLTNK